MKKEIDEFSQLENGVLTEPMDIGSKEYEDFKLLIRSKVAETPKVDRIKIGLLGLQYQMEDELDARDTQTYIGSYIRKFIKIIEVKQVDFAKYLGMRPSNLSKILSGERKLNTHLALILQKLSGIDAQLWLRIQNQNEINKIEKGSPNATGKYKLAELIK